MHLDTHAVLARLGAPILTLLFFASVTSGAELVVDRAGAVDPAPTSVSFTDIGAGLPQLSSSCVAWGDYDNDGDLDLFIAGYADSGRSSRIYENDAGTFSNIGAGLPGVSLASAAWGDYDNDGDLDLAFAGYTGLAYPDDRIGRVYENDGGTFTLADGLSRVSSGSIAWGDYDNDGDLDLLLTGELGWSHSFNPVTRVYENVAGSFGSVVAGIASVRYGSAAWGDYDNDGDLDVLVAGEGYYGRLARVYENDGGTFTDIGAGLPGVEYCSVAWGDYDNDGDLDILLAGDTGSGYVAKVYENDGGGFTDIAAALPGVRYSSTTWGDYDNDGDLDILLAGDTGTERISRVYRNDEGSFTFTAAGLTGVSSGGAVWGDYDNDRDLDVLLSGYTGIAGPFERVSCIYRSDGASPNTAPSAPSNLSFVSGNHTGTFSWNAGSDGQTPTSGLTYNLRVGTTPGGEEICPTMADLTNGYRRVVRSGNAQQRTSWMLNLLPDDYYWSVQTVDGAFEGSAFATEQSVTVPGFTDIGAGLPEVGGVGDCSATWGDYDNDGDLDVLLAGDSYYGRLARVYENDGGTFADIGAGLPGVNYCSVAWGDYDNDGDLDILLTGYAATEYISRVYENDGGSFTDIGAGLPGVSYSSVAWGDYDNDGDLDILLTGYTGSAGISRVYRNDGGNSFTDIGAGLTGVYAGSVACGDYDNDGDLDILLTGSAEDSVTSRVYENDAGTFTDINAGLLGVYWGDVAWGDYDSDGDLDILLTGRRDVPEEFGRISRVYENDAGTFTDVGAGLPGVFYSTVAWGDYDNDGDLDILITGSAQESHISRVYENDGGTFTDIEARLPGVWFGAAAWGDHDNDGDLDILLIGDSEPENTATVYCSYGMPPNTVPAAPSNLSFSAEGHAGTFSWDDATDAETPSAGLTYNLRIGTTPGGDEVCSSMSDGATGYRRVARMGNTQHRASWTVDLEPGEYYWSAQAVDGAFAGSAFALEDSCKINTVQFTDIGADLPGATSSSAEWGDYDNDGDLDVLFTGATTWRDTSCVYRNDEGVFVDIVSWLPGVANGSSSWGDYDNDGDLDILLTGHTGWEAIARVYENDAGTFTDIDAGLEGVYYSSAAWGDSDSDGDLDILLTGYADSGATSRVYRNDEGTFTDVAAGLEGVCHSSVAWGDYDDDGDPDILLTGDTGSGQVSRVYENYGGVFADIGAALTGVERGSVAWGDYDNDGDLDILLTGYTGTERISRVYENDARVFVDTGAGLPGVFDSSVAWGDCDNDGDLDILLTGHTGVEPISRVYENDAGSFADAGAGLTGVESGSSAWGDYDNDGDLDILLTGQAGPERISRVYRSDGATANTAPAVPSNLSFHLSGGRGSFSWNAATDDETPSEGLSYNLRIGTTPGGEEICPGMADAATGHRRVVQLGNAGNNTTRTIAFPDTFIPCAYWTVQALDTAFEGSPFAVVETVLVAGTGVADSTEGAGPLAFRLHPSTPNPFNPRSAIRYELPVRAPVRIAVYDVAGRLVRTLVDAPVHVPGRHEVIWDGRDASGRGVASGVYFCRMESADYRKVRKMALVR